MKNKYLVSHVEWTVVIVTLLEWSVMMVTLIGGFFYMNYLIDYTIEATNARFDKFIIEWNGENKDFHGRPCSIQERKIGK